MAPDFPELVEGSFVPDALSLFISDKLFRVKMVQGAPIFIHVLTEHKSYPDRKVGWQITRGIMACTEQSIREMGKNWESLPAVISVLIYHGNSPWNYPNDLISLVDANSAMHPWLLNIRYILVDLSITADSLLSRHARLRAGFLALKYGTRSPEEQMEALGQIADALRDAPELLVPVMIYLMATFTLLKKETVHEIIMQVKPEEETEMMSQFAQEILNNGKPEWATMVRQEGWQEGRKDEAAAMLLKQMRRKFGQTSDWATEKVRSANLELIEIWSDNFVFANSVDEVFAP
ncbi:MAG: Rpn family recombination-promoting nuclease/putative transposase [Magnetococcales bacterium]|nr:Rpn family recombination-promoting nuclease/putative transposase [Magnetococcales bacterium]MBF0437774.1 Rpn family recombination-promoting nuclease/putative transposase [Magnetococcales bacterium]